MLATRWSTLPREGAKSNPWSEDTVSFAYPVKQALRDEPRDQCGQTIELQSAIGQLPSLAATTTSAQPMRKPR